MSNLEIWNAVCETDPNHTKRVNQRGGFTAIDAHYQIMLATKQFGPVGIGWGYIVEGIERMDTFVVAHVTLWHGDRGNTFGPVPGCAEMFGKRPDHDAPKKATTDAITKGLSHLGFNADVFLGLFDDNKYIEARRRAAEQQREPTPQPTVSPDQYIKLRDKAQEAGVSEEAICERAGCPDLQQFPAAQFGSVMKKLAVTIEQRAPKNADLGGDKIPY